MKHFTFILILLLLSITVFGQENFEHKSMSEQFLKQTGIKQLLDSIIQKEQIKITTNAPRFFNQKNLDFSIKEDKIYFIKNINERLSFIKENINNELLFRLDRYSAKDLSKLINKQKMRKYNYTLIKNHLSQHTQIRLGNEISKLYRNIIPTYLQNIAQRHKKISLKIMLNHQVVSANNLDINLFLNTNCPERKRINILDKENSKINKPQDCDYKQIENLVVTYKRHTFVFDAKTTKINFPSRLVEIKSLLSKYSFEKIPNWNIYIDETKESISIEIENVVLVKKSINLSNKKASKKKYLQINKTVFD